MRCGHATELDAESGRIRPVCPRCGFVYYFAPQVAAVAVVTREGDDRFLLVRRGENPGKGLWGLPGGYVELGETADEALLREVQEETGYLVDAGARVGVWSFFNETKQIAGVALVYATRVRGGALAVASDSTAAAWVEYQELSSYRLAFESHREALRVWELSLHTN